MRVERLTDSLAQARPSSDHARGPADLDHNHRSPSRPRVPTPRLRRREVHLRQSDIHGATSNRGGVQSADGEGPEAGQGVDGLGCDSGFRRVRPARRGGSRIKSIGINTLFETVREFSSSIQQHLESACPRLSRARSRFWRASTLSSWRALVWVGPSVLLMLGQSCPPTL